MMTDVLSAWRSWFECLEVKEYASHLGSKSTTVSAFLI